MTASLEEIGLRYEVDGVVATVTLCRSETRNAQSPRMWTALAKIGRSLPDGVRVVLLRAEGVSFSAGLDRRMFTPEGVPGDTSLAALTMLDDAALADAIAAFQDAFSWWRRPEIVSIAVVQGHAVGAGFQLALACDLRVVADDARFSMREPSLGLVPDLGGTQPLVEAVGFSRALEICLSGRWVDASEAAEIGLATIVVRRDELDATAADLATAMAAPSAGAVAGTKALLQGARTRSYEEQLRAERETQVRRLRALSDALTGNNPG
jgi:enoyl-CoA hydratase/carnithine racemase